MKKVFFFFFLVLITVRVTGGLLLTKGLPKTTPRQENNGYLGTFYL